MLVCFSRTRTVLGCHDRNAVDCVVGRRGKRHTGPSCAELCHVGIECFLFLVISASTTASVGCLLLPNTTSVESRWDVEAPWGASCCCRLGPRAWSCACSCSYSCSCRDGKVDVRRVRSDWNGERALWQSQSQFGTERGTVGLKRWNVCCARYTSGCRTRQ